MALFVLSLCPFDISVGVGAFVIGLSQISSFFSLNTRVRMIRDRDAVTIATGEEVEGSNESESTPHFRSKTMTVLPDEDREGDLNSCFQQMTTAIEGFISRGSEWRLDHVLSIEVATVPYTPLGGSSYLPLPAKFSGIRSVVNVKNEDQRCFMWSILAALHPAPRHAERLSHYEEYVDELNMAGMQYPITMNQIPRFERQNEISVNVFGMEDGEIFPLFLSKLETSRMEIDLLFLQEEDATHYCLIKDINQFLTLTKKARIKHYFCHRCLHGFVREDLLRDHQPYCKKFDFQRVTYPQEGYNVLEFTSYHKQMRVPFVVYANFESLVRKVDNCSSPSEQSNITHESHFEPCGYAFKVVD